MPDQKAPEPSSEGPPGAEQLESSRQASALPRFFGQFAPIDAGQILKAMPVLRYLALKRSEDPRTQGALERYHFIFVLHFLSDLIGLIEAYRLSGLSWERSHFLYKDYLYPYKSKIEQQLVGHGADVMPLIAPDVLATVVRHVVTESKADGRKILIVEDGGYLVPLIHTAFRDDLASFAGAVEQTTKGVRQDEAVVPLGFPVLSVAGAKVKTQKESPEIARLVWTNAQRLLWYQDLRGRPVLVVGYGSIGRNLAFHLRSNGIKVRVFDKDERRRDQARNDGYDVGDDLPNLIGRQSDLIVIGTTGNTSIGVNEILALGNNSVLVSASSDQREIAVADLRKLSDDGAGELITHPASEESCGHRYRILKTRSEITLLADGYPVNFWNVESLPYGIAQVALVPLFLSTLAIADPHPHCKCTGQPDPDLVDRLVDEEGIFDQL